MDVITPDGIAIDIKDAVSELALRSSPELLGRLVQALVANGALNAADLSQILPPTYEVRA